MTFGPFQPMGERWNYTDFKYKKKKIGSYIVELLYGTQRGGQIKIWTKAVEKDVNDAIALPHIFAVTPKKDYRYVHAVHFMDWRNAVYEFNKLKSGRAIWDLIERDE